MVIKLSSLYQISHIKQTMARLTSRIRVLVIYFKFLNLLNNMISIIMELIMTRTITKIRTILASPPTMLEVITILLAVAQMTLGMISILSITNSSSITCTDNQPLDFRETHPRGL